MYFIFIFLFVQGFWSVAPYGNTLTGAGCRCFAASVKELDKKIKTHRKDLERLQEQIRELESKKGRLKHDEETLKKTLKRIESDIEQSTKKQVRHKKQIRETESWIKRAAQEVHFFSSEGLKWEESIFSDLRNYYTELFYPQRLRRDVREDWALRSLISLKVYNLKSVDSKRDLSLQREKQLLNYKKNLIVLKEGLEKEIQKQKSVQSEKSQLYKTTSGKRIIAEGEVERLRETSEELEKLISHLRLKKEKSLAAQREAELLKKSFQEKRGTFPWPVSGTVVSPFGREKHPELNITVINNGVRIRTESNSPVKSVEKGRVIFAADFRSYGQTVILDHGGDTYSIYGLLGNILVNEGEKVGSGKILGHAGSNKSPLIYFELRNQGWAEDPLLWLK